MNNYLVGLCGLMDKRTTVIESIQKLLGLGMPDREIIENLCDVGLSEDDALVLIEEAKKPMANALKKSGAGLGNKSQFNKTGFGGKDRKIYDDSLDKASMQDQIVEQIPLPGKDSASVSDVAKSSADELSASGANSTNEPKELVQEQNSSVVQKKKVDEKSIDAKRGTVEKAGLRGLETSIDSLINKPKFSMDDSEMEMVVGESGSFGDALKKSTTNNLDDTAVVVELIDSSTKNVPVNGSNLKESFEKKGVVEGKGVAVLETKKPFLGISSKVSSGKGEGYENPNKMSDLSSEVTPDYDEIWKKGIVVAVNAKLSEMKRIKEEIDSELSQKVDEAIRRELYQFKVLMDSQKELISSSNRAALEEKQKEIVFIIDAKIAELKHYNKQLSESIMAIDSSRAKQELALKQVEETLEEAKKAKSQLIVEMNSEMIKIKSSTQAFLDNASSHLVQMDQRISKALELERNIAEGMLAQAEQKIEQLTIQRADELIAKLEIELNRLRAVSKNISPETLEQKIRVLDEFRHQFLNNMQQGLSQINSAIEELNEKSIAAERALQEKTLAIDAKLEELTKFEKEFSSKLEEALKSK